MNSNRTFFLMLAFVAILVASGLGVILITDSRQQAAQSGGRVSSFEEISLERTECFGMCPVYRLTISGSGAVHYEGQESVATIGPLDDRLSDTQLKELLAALNESDFFALRDGYRNELDGCAQVWSDNPSVIVSVTVAGKTKRIHHYLGCGELRRENPEEYSPYPNRLFIFENRVDELVGTKRWIKGEPSSGK